MRNTILTLVALLVTFNAQAHQGITAAENPQDQTISLTINNKYHEWLSSYSSLVPADARLVAPYSSVVFKINKPQEEGIQKIRYEETPGFGCDFFIDTQNISVVSDTPAYVTFVVPIPISSSSVCQVHTSGFANHLTYERITL